MDRHPAGPSLVRTTIRAIAANPLVALGLALLLGCTDPSLSPPGAMPSQVRQRRFAMSVLAPGQTPVDLTEYVRNPTYLAAAGGADFRWRAEVHANASRELADRVARELHEAARESGEILGTLPTGTLVLHLIALPMLPTSYRYAVTYRQGDAGMNYLFETAFFYAEGDDPLSRRDSSSLRSLIFRVIPHEISHRLCGPRFTYQTEGNGPGLALQAPRWLDDGVAEFVAARVASKLAPDLENPNRSETGRKVLGALREAFLDWPEAGHSDENWKGFPAPDLYAAARELVESLFGGDVRNLQAFLASMSQGRLRNHDDLRALIRRQSGTDPETLLRRF